MTPEYWQKVKGILDQAIEIAPGERAEFLAAACIDDEVLRREVESLMRFDDETDLLENPAFSLSANEESILTAAAFTGKTIGNYRIIGELGSGGMGTVFLAERADGAFDQKVALKLIKRGMDSDAVLRRFFNERRILASLEHPNIARLIDGGTTVDGVPYFVMEYVDGVPITDHIKNENLSIEARLDLFREVASAVSFAHQNLIIHRDLKPSNILVTADGQPKLLDFGIAKLLTADNDGLITATQQFALTPEYASPEQVRGETLTTATDIYSLGIILYELLTGQRPYQAASGNFGEIIRVVCETDPARPSSIEGHRSLRGDLDNIILKALRKEPERRYLSLEQFSEDLRRHLAGLPVTVGGNGVKYLARKFVVRHRYAVAASTLVLVTLIGGLVATLYQANIAQRERAKAEQRFDDVRRLTNSIMFEMNDKIEESPIKARELLVTRAIEYLDRLVQEVGDDPEIQIELATAYEKIGDIQAKMFNPALGRPSDAMISHQRSLAIREKLFAADGNNISRGVDVLKSRMAVADIYSMSGKLGEAREQYQSAVDLGEGLLRSGAGDEQFTRILGSSYARLGQAVLRSGSLGDALKNYEKALKIYQDKLAQDPGNLQLQRSISVMYSYIGYVHLEMLKLDEAAGYFQKELEINEKLSNSDESNAQFRNDASDGHFWLGVTLGEMGRFEESLFHLHSTFSIQKTIYETDPANIGLQNGLADCYLQIGRVLAKSGQSNAAIENYLLAIKNYEAVWQVDEQNLSAKRQVVYTQRFMADALTQKGETQKALALYLQALKDFSVLIESDPDNTEWQADLAICHLRTGECLLKNKDKTAAAGHFQTALTLFEKLSQASPENARILRDLELTRGHIRNIS